MSIQRIFSVVLLAFARTAQLRPDTLARPAVATCQANDLVDRNSNLLRTLGRKLRLMLVGEQHGHRHKETFRRRNRR